LNDNSSGYNWVKGIPDAPGTCMFENPGYHVTVSSPNHSNDCIASSRSAGFSNFAFEVQMTFLKGSASSYGGMLFRLQDRSFYFFGIGRNGDFELIRFDDVISGNATQLLFTPSAAIHTDLNVPNTLAVVARGGMINLYVNLQLLTPTPVNDSSYSQGQIGFIAAEDRDAVQGEVTEVAFSDVKVWKLP